jgi:hypothetical protein
MSVDYYAEVRAIAEALVEEGLSSDAEALKGAMAAARSARRSGAGRRRASRSIEVLQLLFPGLGIEQRAGHLRVSRL